MLEELVCEHVCICETDVVKMTVSDHGYSSVRVIVNLPAIPFIHIPYILAYKPAILG